jgi:hypothetical protein
MTTEYKTYKIKDFIRKTPKGELDIDKSMRIVWEIAAAAGFHHDHNLLVDLRQTEPLSNFGDVLKVATEFAKYQGVFQNKIAVVIPNTPDRLERAQLFIEALGEVTFKIEYFTAFEEAIEWFSEIIKYP